MAKSKERKRKERQIEHMRSHRLKTRRDFLSHGLVAGSAFAFAPSLLSLLSNKVMAQECGALDVMGAGSKTPVLLFDLSGGANIAGSSVMAGGPGGQKDFLEKYTTLGLTDDMHPSMTGQLNEELGLAFHSDSGFLRGIQANTSQATRSNVDGGIFCNVSDDDTGNNPHNPAYWLNRAGAMGQLAQLAGTSNSVTGGRSTAPSISIDPSRHPVSINSPRDAMGLVTAGKLNEIFPDDAKVRKVLDTIKNLSQSKIRQFNNQTLPQQIKTLVECGYIQTNEFLEKYDSTALDPAADQDITQVFDLNNGNERRTASIIKLLMDGYVGVGTVQLGGYDYHTSDRSTGEIRDLIAGNMIGKALEYANLKGKDLVIYIFTDGGVAARGGIDDSEEGRGKLAWTSENGNRSSTFMLVHKSDGRPAIRLPGRQVGHMRENGSVETNATLISNSVTNLAKAVVANYLSLHGEEGELSRIVGDNPFGSDLGRYLIFDKLR
jgi:hypothetical protein